MNNVTHILSQIECGDPSAAEQLLPLVYQELRKLAAARLAHEMPGQTLQATALVHDAYIKLVNAEQADGWNSPGHFFAAAAEAMRRISVNRARDKGRLKRGVHMQRVDLEHVHCATDAPSEMLLAIDETLVRLEQENPNCANVVKLRFFAGLTIEETATALNISPQHCQTAMDVCPRLAVPRSAIRQTPVLNKFIPISPFVHDPKCSPTGH